MHWIAGKANILSKYKIYIFCNFGHGFCGSFPMLFPKAPASCFEKNLDYFLLHCTSIYMSSKSVSQIFKFLFQTGDINIFVFRGVFFSRYFQLKFLWVQGAHMFFLYNIVTRNNMVWKLMRRLLCYCKTFSLVPDSTECTIFFYGRKQYIICTT